MLKMQRSTSNIDMKFELQSFGKTPTHEMKINIISSPKPF